LVFISDDAAEQLSSNDRWLDGAFSSRDEFGVPFIAYHTGPGMSYGTKGYAWNYKAVFFNTAIFISTLAVIAYFLERRIRRRNFAYESQG